MTTRIRYEKTDKDDIVVSTRNFHSITTDAMYIVYLNLKDVTYTIKNMLSERKYSGGDDINNLHVLKRHAKSRLEKLGVSFGDEIRDNASRISGVNCGYKAKDIDDKETDGST